MRVPLEWMREFVSVRQKVEDLAERLTMAGLEVEAVERLGKDFVLDIAVTPNRSDCLSIIGIAREVAALTDASLKSPARKPAPSKGGRKPAVQVQVRSKVRCPRYCAQVMEGVRIGPSPAWIAGRLAACGIRPVNNVVDATNYVMLETGQPMHAFDLGCIRGGRIVVRTASAGESIVTLDGVKRDLERDDLLICDGRGPVAIAGVMGGADSEVRESTTSLLLESACFEPTGVRRTSRRLSLSSESSRRFERGVDPAGSPSALRRLAGIIEAIAGGKTVATQIDIYPGKTPIRKLTVSELETERTLGISLGVLQMGKILRQLGFSAERAAGGKLKVAVPSFRFDIERPIDLIEEIARVHGYDRIPETMPRIKIASLARPRFHSESIKVRGALVEAGFSETLLYGFTSEKSLGPFAELGQQPVRIMNPISSEQGVMCTTLLPGLLDSLKLNANRQRPHCRLFSLQRVFFRPMAMGPSDEPRRLAGVMSGPRFPGAWERAREMIDFYDAKGVVESVLAALKLDAQAIFQRGDAHRFLHPGAFAYLIVGGKRVGFVGELHPETASLWDLKDKVFVFELGFEAMSEVAAAHQPRFSGISRFPFVERDLALLVGDRVPSVEIERVVQDCDVDLVDGVRIFDVYRGKGLPEGFKSLGVSLKFARSDRTLTDEEIEFAQGRIVDALKMKLGAELRT